MKNLILSTYFSLKKHPNHPGDTAVRGRAADGRVWQSDFKYIENWYNSIVKNRLNAVLFYDNLEEDFVKSYENEHVSFKKVTTSDYSNNDWRFFCFYDFLEELKGKGQEPYCVFHTDASDVVVVKDPHELVNSHQEYDYFACKDSIPLKDFGYMKVHEHFNWEDRLMFLLNIEDWWLINMGVVGGKFSNMLEFYKNFKSIREEMGSPEFNSDMWICQYLLRSKLQSCNLLMGDPVCSNFKQYETEREDVYFIHK